MADLLKLNANKHEMENQKNCDLQFTLSGHGRLTTENLNKINVSDLKIFFIVFVSGFSNKTSVRLTGSSNRSRVLWMHPGEYLE